MQYTYLALFLISLMLIPIYLISVKKGYIDHWFLIFIVCVSIVNLGYLLISVAGSVEFALFANKIAYLGQVILPMCMLIIITKLCGYKLSKKHIIVLISCAAAMFALVCTTGYLDWYYKSATIEKYGAVTILHKEYGVLHPLNLVYVSLYFIAMVVTLSFSFNRKKGLYKKQAAFMLTIVAGNLAMWLVQKVIPWNFEFLSLTYLISAGAFLSLYLMLQDYVHVNNIPIYSPKEQEKLGTDILTMPMDEKLKRVLYFVREGEILCSREREILELILQNKKRKEIASLLFLSENTIKTYTRTLYSKLGVACREELYSLLLQN